MNYFSEFFFRQKIIFFSQNLLKQMQKKKWTNLEQQKMHTPILMKKKLHTFQHILRKKIFPWKRFVNNFCLPIFFSEFFFNSCWYLRIFCNVCRSEFHWNWSKKKIVGTFYQKISSSTRNLKWKFSQTRKNERIRKFFLHMFQNIQHLLEPKSQFGHFWGR